MATWTKKSQRYVNTMHPFPRCLASTGEVCTSLTKLTKFCECEFRRRRRTRRDGRSTYSKQFCGKSIRYSIIRIEQVLCRPWEMQGSFEIFATKQIYFLPFFRVVTDLPSQRFGLLLTADCQAPTWHRVWWHYIRKWKRHLPLNSIYSFSFRAVTPSPYHIFCGICSHLRHLLGPMGNTF